jgi:hypothetical protein
MGDQRLAAGSGPQSLQYVKICSLYGAGFFYIPGTDTCLKVGGYVRAEVNVNAGGSFAPLTGYVETSNRAMTNSNWRVRGAATFDARSQTEYGTLRSYLFLSMTDTNSTGTISGLSTTGVASTGNGTGASGYNSLYAPAAFIQFAGFTAGKTASFFDFDGQPYSNQSNIWSSNQGGNGIELFAYTAQFGNGLSASISAENPAGRNNAILNPAATSTVLYTTTGATTTTTTTTSYNGYARQTWPDIVGNLRLDQAWGSAQVMGALHNVTAQDGIGAVTGHPDDKVGWAIGAGLKVNLPMLGKGDYVMGQFTYGEGAVDYVGSGLPSSWTVVDGTTKAVANVSDAVWGATGTELELTKGWSITGGYEHFWNTQWKTSLYGSYGTLMYSDTASAILRPTTAAVGSSADWSYWQVGSRTVWTPVTNLDLSVDVMYNSLNTAWTGATYADQDWVSGMFRVQRNFYP